MFIDVTSFRLSDLPKNRKPIEMPGVKHICTKMISLKAIDCDSQRNSVRLGGMSEYAGHVQELVNSFNKGVDPFRPLPIVEYLESPITSKDGSVMEYGSVDCHHRIAALNMLGVTEYPFDVYLFENDVSRTMFQYEMNNHYPAKKNTDDDIVNGYADMIQNKNQFKDSHGDVDIDALEASLAARTVLRAGTERMNKIIGRIIEGSGAQTKNKNYVNDQGEKWISVNMPGRVLGSKRGDLWIFKTGTWERTYQRMKRAIFNERKQGVVRVHEIILNVEARLQDDIAALRQKFISDIEMAFEVDGFLTDGNTSQTTQHKYFKISYALPQIRDGSEDMNKPVAI
jgi:hypothetical protein